MYKLNKYLVTAFYSVFFSIFLWIFCNVLIDMKSISLNIIYVVIGTFLLGGTAIYLSYLYQRFNSFGISAVTICRITILLICVILCYSGITFAVIPKVWDLGTVYDSAYQLAMEHELSHDYLYRYFKRFPNNVGILAFLTVVYKVVAFFRITSKVVYIYVGIAINIMMILLSIIITYKLCIILFHQEKATLFLIMMLFCTPLYLYASTFYTDTLALLFPPLILYTYVKYDQKKDMRVLNKLGYLFLISCYSFFGLKLKTTILIVLVAIAIVLFLQRRYLDLMKRVTIVACSMMVVSSMFNVAIDKSGIFNFAMKDAGTVPYTHWIMMGMIGDGGWSEEEYNYTYSFETVEEAQQGNVDIIKDRLTQYGVGGYLKFLTHKATVTWQDGTYSGTYYTDLYPLKRTNAHEFVTDSGIYKKYITYFSQCCHMLILIFILVGLFKRICNKQIDYMTIAYLALFGLLLFLLLWESKPRYLVHYIPMIYLCAIDGIPNRWSFPLNFKMNT